MLTAAAALLFTLAALQPVYTLGALQPAGQERQPRTPQTDQTVAVTRGSRLSIDNFAGEVILHTWDRDSLRVQARHGTRTRINVRNTAAGVAVGTSSSNGPSGPVDYDITAPAWMAVKVEGQYNFVTIDGVQSEVSVQTVRGDIVIKGGAGSVTAKSIEGQVIVEGARGRINVSSVNEAIKITGSSGEIVAETTNGDITLSRIDSPAVEVGTVNGDITYEGTLLDKGRYRFTTHNGDIVMVVPETSNATFTVRTYNGDFGSSNLPVKGPARSEVRGGKRVSYTLGNGSAEVEVESFGGAIRLRRAGAR